MKKKKNNLKSTCCGAEVKIGGIGDFEGDKSACTQYYVCIQCQEACDVYLKERKTWTRNPVTKVKGDERGKYQEKLTKKEIDTIRKNEDF